LSSGEPYEMKFTYNFGNVIAREVERPEILSEFFKYSNKIDVNNRKRQSNLKLEKRWLTKNPHFRLFTTLVGKADFFFSCFYSLFTHFLAGINVVDTYNLCEYHHIINYRLPKEGDHKMTVQRFAGHLSYQLIRNGSGLLRVLKPVRREATQLLEEESVPTAISSESQSSAISSLSANNTPPAVTLAERVLTDAQGGLHHQCSYPVGASASGKKRTMTRECALCKEEEHDRRLVGTYCFDCQLPLCCVSKWNPDRDCFDQHVAKIRQTSGRGV